MVNCFFFSFFFFLVSLTFVTLNVHELLILRSPSLDRLDGKHVVFGQVKDGFEVVTKMESFGLHDGGVMKKIVIADCGEIK